MIHWTEKVLIKCNAGGPMVSRVGCELRIPEFDSCSEEALFSREPAVLKFVWLQLSQEKYGGLKNNFRNAALPVVSSIIVLNKKSSISQPILFTIGQHEITAKKASRQ